MTRRTYTPETKAAVLAALLTGEAYRAVSERFDVPVATLQYWHQQTVPKPYDAIGTEKKDELGELVTEYVRESLRTLRVQAEQFAGREWLAKQNAADAAILHGVLADKTIRVIQAIHDDSK